MEENAVQINEVSLRDYVDILRRRKAIVIQTFVVVFAVGAIATFLAKPVYRTNARILVEGKVIALSQSNTNDPLNVITPDPGHDVATQIEILQGEDLLKQAYAKSGIPDGSVHLEVKQVGSTDVIELIVESIEAKKATQFALVLPETYLKFFTGNRRTELENALDFAQTRLKQETSSYNAAYGQLQVLRTRSKMYSIKTERERRLSEKNESEAQLQKLEAQIAGDNAKYNRVLNEESHAPKELVNTATVPNAMIDPLREKLVALKSQRNLAVRNFKPSHESVKQIDGEISELESRLNNLKKEITTTTRSRNPAIAEYDKQLAEIRIGLSSSQALYDQTQRRVVRANSDLKQFSTTEPMQEQYEDKAERAKNTIVLLTKDVDDLNLRLKLAHDPVKVLTPAVAAKLVAPQKTNNLIYSALVGLILGFCFALLQEFMDDRINSPEDTRRLMEAPILGYVPLITDSDRLLLTNIGSGTMIYRSFSLLESYRTLRSNVQFASVDNPNISVLVTSTTPGEGKSVTASNLAVALALDGKRVILVDADLRRPTIHDKFGVTNKPGLTNVLIGHTKLKDALKQSDIPGLSLLTSGPNPPNPAELLNSQVMRHIHSELKQMADIVIFDSPPFLATADAQVLSALTDGVLYVIQFGEARKSAVKHSVQLMRQAHANLLGVVFNKIDLSQRRDDYYYGYYGYYQYYQSAEGQPGDKRMMSTREFEALLAMSKNKGEFVPRKEDDDENHSEQQ